MDPLTQFQSGFGVYPWDVNGDGWIDAVVVPHHGEAMVWYENPKADVHWPVHTIAAAGVFSMEYGIVVDLFGDGRPVALMGDSQDLVVSWYVPGPDPTQPWIAHPVSPTGFPGAA